MNKQIWKYLLKAGKHTVRMPKGGEILTTQSIDDDAFVWAMVNPLNELEERHFETFGTGHVIPCDMGIERKYIGTFQMDNGALVFHVFERV